MLMNVNVEKENSCAKNFKRNYLGVVVKKTIIQEK